MNIDLSKLEGVKQSNGKTIAACPACRADDGDSAGNHLVIFDNGAFGCARFSGSSPEAREHRKTILQMVGKGEKRRRKAAVKTPPEAFLRLPPTPKEQKPVILGRFGRSFSTYARTSARADTCNVIPEQASEPSEDIVEIAKRMFRAVAVWDDPHGLDFETWNCLRRIDGILSLRDGKGRVAYTASQIDSCIIALRLHADEHPQNAAMLARLREAKKNALSAVTLADRMTKGHRA